MRNLFQPSLREKRKEKLNQPSEMPSFSRFMAEHQGVARCPWCCGGETCNELVWLRTCNLAEALRQVFATTQPPRVHGKSIEPLPCCKEIHTHILTNVTNSRDLTSRDSRERFMTFGTVAVPFVVTSSKGQRWSNQEDQWLSQPLHVIVQSFHGETPSGWC